MPTSPAPQTLAAPAALGAIVASAGAALVLLGPQTVLPITCPFLALTGWACPLCGGTRSTAALLEGDVAAAVDLNAFTVVAVLVMAGVWLAWVVSRFRGRVLAAVPPTWLWAAVVAVGVAFAVVRNLPGPLSALAP